jgi:3-oxoacyl-[acyl-carrier protein] reductase
MTPLFVFYFPHSLGPIPFPLPKEYVRTAGNDDLAILKGEIFNMLLKDKVVLVTGGARGIGAAIVRVLAREGAVVAINCNTSREKADGLAESINSSGGRAKAWCADITDADAVRLMISEIYEEFGRLDGVINNAIAGVQTGRLQDVSWNDYETAFDYGAKAVLNTVNAARPIMSAQGGGRIVNIVSEQWNFAGAGWSVYLAGKGAMVGLSRVMAEELGPENITVNMIAPGWMRTEKVTDETDTAGYVPNVPLGKQGDAEEIGKVCAFLLSDLADFVSGAYIPVCGGTVRQTGS